jgi:hypothetical protein
MDTSKPSGPEDFDTCSLSQKHRASNRSAPIEFAPSDALEIVLEYIGDSDWLKSSK